MHKYALALLLLLALPGAASAPVYTGGTEDRGEPVPVETPQDPLAAIVGPEVAVAVYREAHRSQLPPALILGVILTENPWLKADTVNSYGAVGLMQVVGWLHLGEHPECGVDLTQVDTNVCYGVRILEQKMKLAGGDTTTALLYYNGCAGATYQAGCEAYSDKVLSRGAQLDR